MLQTLDDIWEGFPIICIKQLGRRLRYFLIQVLKLGQDRKPHIEQYKKVPESRKWNYHRIKKKMTNRCNKDPNFGLYW